MQDNKESRLLGYHFGRKKRTAAYELCEDSFDDSDKIVEIEKNVTRGDKELG